MSKYSDAELTEIILKICNCEYSESEMDSKLELLEQETGLSNISDYIFCPDEIGLALDAEPSEIVEKILSDKKI